MQIKNINVFLKDKFVLCDLEFTNKITNLTIIGKEDAKYEYAIPRYFDPHTHGGYGIDFNKIDQYSLQQIEDFIKQEKQEGLQNIFITTVTDSLENLKKIGLVINDLCKKYSFFAGWHLEGPFINNDKCGAHNQDLIIPLNEEFLEWLKKNITCKIMFTFAPEVSNNLAIACKYQSDFYWSIGHTCIDAKQLEQLHQLGFNRITHLCNAMNEFNHKENQAQILNYVLVNNLYCEVIYDYIHVNKLTLQIINNNISNKYLGIVSDSLPAKGLADTNYLLGSVHITKKGEICYIANTNTLAGSCNLYCNLVTKYFNLTNNLKSLVYLSSINQVKYFKIKGYMFSINADASFLIINQEGRIIKIYEHGTQIN